MRYVLVDEDGALHVRDATDYAKALADLGPEGWDTVRLAEGARVRGFVNDCGLVMEHYRRNVVGACLLVSLGAAPQPYAGPVVVTGWDPDPYAEDVEVRPLTDVQVTNIRVIHTDIRRVLGLDKEEPSGQAVLRWQATMREYAAWMPDAPVRPVQLLTDPADVMAALRGMK